MSEVEELVRKYLPTQNVMQLATVRGDQPWSCNVHFYSDDNLNLYWISEPGRRHSLEIKDNPNVSVAVKIHENTASEDYVIGIALQGTAELMGEFDGNVAAAYRDKLGKNETFVDDMKNDRKPYKFYKLTPTMFVMFNTKDFEGSPRQEWTIDS